MKMVLLKRKLVFQFSAVLLSILLVFSSFLFTKRLSDKYENSIKEMNFKVEENKKDIQVIIAYKETLSIMKDMIENASDRPSDFIDKMIILLQSQKRELGFGNLSYEIREPVIKEKEIWEEKNMEFVLYETTIEVSFDAITDNTAVFFIDNLIFRSEGSLILKSFICTNKASNADSSSLGVTTKALLEWKVLQAKKIIT